MGKFFHVQMNHFEIKFWQVFKMSSVHEITLMYTRKRTCIYVQSFFGVISLTFIICSSSVLTSFYLTTIIYCIYFQFSYILFHIMMYFDYLLFHLDLFVIFASTFTGYDSLFIWKILIKLLLLFFVFKRLILVLTVKLWQTSQVQTKKRSNVH